MIELINVLHESKLENFKFCDDNDCSICQQVYVLILKNLMYEIVQTMIYYQVQPHSNLQNVASNFAPYFIEFLKF